MDHAEDFIVNCPSTLEVILKVAELCNIDCTYCYYYHGGNDAFKFHPGVFKASLIGPLIDWLDDAVEDLNLSGLGIDLHGGEPLLMKKFLARELFEQLEARFAGRVDLKIRIQTNGMLVDDAWIEIFSDHGIQVGVSIDGPRAYHDEHRVDKKGRGTYDAVVKGFRRLQEEGRRGRIPMPGILCTIDPERDARRIYRHFVEDLEAKGMNFLIPVATHDGFSGDVGPYARYITGLFDEWMGDFERTRIKLKMFGNIIYALEHTEQFTAGFRELIPDPCILTVNSDGSIGPEDDLRVIPERLFDRGCTIFNTRCSDFIYSRFYLDLCRGIRTVPADCAQCCWKRACRGGQEINRFSSARRFDNPSLLCEALQEVHAHVSAWLLRSKRVTQAQLVGNLLPVGDADEAREQAVPS